MIRLLQSPRTCLSVLTVAMIMVVLISMMVHVRLSHMAQRAHAASQDLQLLEQEAVELLYLRDQEERISWNAKPESDLLALVNDTLVRANIPNRKLEGLSAQSDAAASNSAKEHYSSLQRSTLRKQMTTITLNALSPSECVRFLSAWRVNAGVWSIEQVEMVHAQPIHRGSSTRPMSLSDDNNQYDVRLVIAALYHAKSTERRQSN